MAEYDFDGRVAFVTGAARGQGRSHALRYAENGADVVCADVCETSDESTYELGDETELDETTRLVEERGQQALGVQMDVSDEAEVEAGVEHAVSAFGRIDFLANNAGVAPVSALIDLDEETWDHALDVNLKGTWLCAGMVASPGLGHYTAAKHGVLGLTKTLAMELAQHDVTVNAVCPTAVDTPMTGGIVESIGEELAAVAEQSGPDNVLGEILQPEDVSAAFMWLSSDDARFVTGIALPVAAGATAI